MGEQTKADLSQTAFQRVVDVTVQKLKDANPALAKASEERLEQKAKDNLWAAIFAVPGLLMLLAWPAVLIWQKMPFAGWNLSPFGLGFVLLVIGAVNGDKDVLTRLQALVPVLQGFVNLILSFIPGRGGNTTPPAAP